MNQMFSLILVASLIPFDCDLKKLVYLIYTLSNPLVTDISVWNIKCRVVLLDEDTNLLD